MLGFHAPETFQLLLCFVVNFMCIITDMHAAESRASGDYASASFFFFFFFVSSLKLERMQYSRG